MVSTRLVWKQRKENREALDRKVAQGWKETSWADNGVDVAAGGLESWREERRLFIRG
jgi:hypothetical protein